MTLEEITNKKRKVIQESLKASLIRCTASTIAKTPVGQGILRNNWMAAFGDADTSTVDTPGSENRALTMIQALPDNTEFYFTNSLPYAARIEYDGHSLKAENGMLRISFRQFNRILKQEIKKRD